MAYRSNPKDWMAFFTFYIAITLFSMWEAMAAQSLSKMVQTKNNFLWNIKTRINNKDPNIAQGTDSFFNEIFAETEMHEDKTEKFEEYINILENLVIDSNFKKIFDSKKPFDFMNIQTFLQGMYDMQHDTNLLGIATMSHNYDGPNLKKNKKIDYFLNSKDLVNEDMEFSAKQVILFISTTMNSIGRLKDDMLKISNKLDKNSNIAGKMQILLDSTEATESETLSGLIESPGEKSEDKILQFVSFNCGWFFFLVIISLSLFTADKTAKNQAIVEWVTIVILIGATFLQLNFLDPFKNISSIKLLNFPKILTFLMFFAINSCIAAVALLFRENDNKANLFRMLKINDNSRNWRYGTPGGIVLANIISLSAGWLMFTILPKMFSSEDKPADENK